MPDYTFVLEAVDVTSSTTPTFDSTGRATQLVNDLTEAKQALDGATIAFTCMPNEVNTRLRQEAEALLAGVSPALSFVKALLDPSLPTTGGSDWAPTGGTKVVHPSQNGSNVCVERTGTPESYSWRQLAFKANAQ